MFIQIEPVGLSFGRDAELFNRLEEIHHRQRNGKRGQGDRKTPNRLRFEHRQPAAVKESCQWSRVVSRYRTSRSVSAAREEAQRERSPDAGEPVHGDGADRIVNPQPFQELHT